MGISLQDRNGTRLADAPDSTARVDDADAVQRPERHRDRRLSVRLAALDVIALAGGWTAGWVTVAWATSGVAPAAAPQFDDIAVGVLASIACLVAFGLYRAPSHGARAAAPATLAQALAVAAVAVTGWQAVFGDAAPGLAVGAAGGGFLAVLTARYGFDVWLLGCRRQGRFLSPVILAGTRADTHALATFLDLNPETGFRAAGCVGSDDDASTVVDRRGRGARCRPDPPRRLRRCRRRGPGDPGDRRARRRQPHPDRRAARPADRTCRRSGCRSTSRAA